jgi:TolA-binding protein
LEEAAATFGQVLDQDPDAALAAEVALARGRIFQELGRHDAALGMYDLVVEDHPQSAQYGDALYAAARLRDELDQDQAAAERYERLAEELPDFPKLDAVLYHWAWALEDQGKPDEAAVLFERVCNEYPQSAYQPDAAFRLADRAYRTGDLASAKQRAEAVLAAGAKDALGENAMYLLGQIAVAEERWADAGAQFQELLEQYPQTELGHHARFGVAEAAFRQGKHEEAEALFARLKVDTQDGDEPWLALVHLRLAQSLAEQKKWPEAYEAASKIGEQFPGFAEQFEADYVVGRALAAQADMEGARQAYRKVIHSENGERTETAAEAQFMIGETHFHQKSYAEALRSYDRVEILYAYPTWQAAALLQAGKCSEQLGEWSEAVRRYKRLIETYPDTPYAKEAAQRLPAAERRVTE